MKVNLLSFSLLCFKSTKSIVDMFKLTLNRLLTVDLNDYVLEFRAKSLNRS